MNHLLNFLKPLFRANYKHPITVLVLSMSLLVISANFALRLKIDTDIANLLPEWYPSVQALNKLKETVGGETSMDVAIKSPSFEANKKAAEYLIQKSLLMVYKRNGEVFFKRAEFKKDIRLLQDNALYLATYDELDEITTFLEEKIEDAKLEANPFFFELDDEDEEEVEEGDDSLTRFRDAYNDLIPSEYPVSADSTVLTFKLFPTGSKSNMRFLRDMFTAYEEMLQSAELKQFHPEMQVRFGGRLQRHVEELDSIMNDVQNSFASGISSVLLLVMLYFFIKKYINYKRGHRDSQSHGLWAHVLRAPTPLVIIGLPLLISLSVTFGITYFMYGTLNTMTSVLFVILFGMGIDYGLHFYARYLEVRSAGNDVIDALTLTYDSTGTAIATSAFTTASALLILMIADFRGFSEFGFISGLGILLALITMIFVLPAILVLFERWNVILVNQNEPSTANEVVQPKRFPYPRLVVALGLGLCVIVGLNTDKLNFEYDFGSLEPGFPIYEEFRAFVGEISNGSSDRRNPAYVIADNREEIDMILTKLEEIKAKTDGNQATIRDIESLQERFPSTEDEESDKLSRVDEIRTLLNDPFIVNQKDDDLDKLRRASITREPVPFDSLPNFIRERFMTKDGEIGKFVIIYPAQKMADGRNSIAFKNDVGTFVVENGKVFHASSTSVVAADMLDLMIKESPYMVSYTFILIVVIMMVAFRSIRWMLMALIPLVVGLIWTFGIMMLFNLSFNFYNLVVLPAILGIGEDNGVHMASRYREEGKNSMWKVISSTGQHITIGSLTTMLGFAGLLTTDHPGLFSIGLIATLGIGMTLISGLTFLPALVQFLEDRNWIRF